MTAAPVGKSSAVRFERAGDLDEATFYLPVFQNPTVAAERGRAVIWEVPNVNIKVVVVWCVAVCILFLCATAPSYADSGSRGSVETILSRQHEIRLEAEAKRNGWDSITDAQRRELIQKQDRVSQLLAGKRQLNDLDSPERSDVEDSLAWIDALAAKAADERRVCQRERATGSNRMISVCRSAGAMRQQREQAKDAMRDASRFRNNNSPSGTER